jgi:hypothetical protein
LANGVGWGGLRTKTSKQQGVEGLDNFIRKLKRFYVWGKGDEFEKFEFEIARIAKETLGFPCFFGSEGKVLHEEELIRGTLFIQDREDTLVCGEEAELKLKLRHKVYIVDIGDGDWIGIAPIEVISVEMQGERHG